jgi:hypothetical protein
MILEMFSKLKLFILATLVLFLTGCTSTLVVHNATANQIATILKDYAGIHGYVITYQNDLSGSYRLSLGNVYVPNTSQTTETQQAAQHLPSEHHQDLLTSYEQTTWETVSVPGHYLEASAMVRISQQGNDVIILLDSNDEVGSGLSDLRDYIQGFNYTVDSK